MNYKNYSPKIKCSNCGYDDQPSKATICIICGHPLPTEKEKLKLKKIILRLKKSFFNTAFFQKNLEYLGLSIIICLGAITVYTSKQAYKNDFVGQDIPEGLFNYSSENLKSSASSIYNIIERKIEQEYSQIDFRYIEYYNNENSVQKLIEGELSFIYTNRPLSASEVEEAKLRGYSFRELPIGIKDTKTLYLIIRTDNSLEARAGKAYYELLNSSIGREIVLNAGVKPAFVNTQSTQYGK